MIPQIINHKCPSCKSIMIDTKIIGGGFLNGQKTKVYTSFDCYQCKLHGLAYIAVFDSNVHLIGTTRNGQ